MKSLPDDPSASTAHRAAGMMAVPGCVSMRNVSHLPPASIISELAKAAPPFVTLLPVTRTVAPLRTPASSLVTSDTACCPAGSCEPTSADARFCNVRPLTRSTTSAGRSSYRNPATHCANCRLRDLPDEAWVVAICCPEAAWAAADGAMRAAPQAARAEPRKLRRSMCTAVPRFLSTTGLPLRHLTFEVSVRQKHSRHMRVAHLVDASLTVADPYRRVGIVTVGSCVVEDGDLMEDGPRRQERRRVVRKRVRDLPVEVEAIDARQDLAPGCAAARVDRQGVWIVHDIRIDGLETLRLAAHVHVRLKCVDARGFREAIVPVGPRDLAGRNLDVVEVFGEDRDPTADVFRHVAFRIKDDRDADTIRDDFSDRVVMKAEPEPRPCLEQASRALREDVAVLADDVLAEVADDLAAFSGAGPPACDEWIGVLNDAHGRMMVDESAVL